MPTAPLLSLGINFPPYFLLYKLVAPNPIPIGNKDLYIFELFKLKSPISKVVDENGEPP